MIVRHPFFPDITLEAKYFPAEKETGEKNYSMGDPPYPAYWEVKEVFYKDFDITEFVAEQCEHLFVEYAEDLLVNIDQKTI